MRGGQARLKRVARIALCIFGIEVVGVEVFTQPLTSLGVLWMSRIGEDFEQLKVAPGAATILGRTPALSGGTGGTGQSLNDGQALFDQERMFPVVTEVVGPLCQGSCPAPRDDLSFSEGGTEG